MGGLFFVNVVAACILFQFTVSVNALAYVSAESNVDLDINCDWNLVIRKINELEKLVKVQGERISELEQRPTDTEWNSMIYLQRTVRRQNQRIGQLEGRIYELETMLEVYENVSVNPDAIEDKLNASDNTISAKTSVIRKAVISQQQRTTLVRSVAFFAYLSSTTPALKANTILPFDKVITNVGNAYYPKSGIFIAPRSGLYVFTWTIRLNRNNYHPTEIVIDNRIINSIYLNPHNMVDSSVTSTIVVNVKKWSKVLIRTSSADNNGYVISTEYGRSTFAGWMLM